MSRVYAHTLTLPRLTVCEHLPDVDASAVRRSVIRGCIRAAQAEVMPLELRRHPWLSLDRTLHTVDTLDMGKNGGVSVFALLMTVEASATSGIHCRQRKTVNFLCVFHPFERCAADFASRIMQVVCLRQASPGLLSAIRKTL